MTEKIVTATVNGMHWSRGEDELHFCLHVSYGRHFQGFGSPNLREKDCGDWIWQIMRILDIKTMDETLIKGIKIRIKIEGSLITAIGHAEKDIWFNPKE